ncbi:nitrate/nitrite transporter NrtS [Nocardia sp. 004]|uniref:nitrate/nitrite transporter NrtS n=1 Tax=Nocardia sp. 004 TaxID=3385978 RepID=UPI0039A31C78
MPDPADQRWRSPTEAVWLLLRGATVRTAAPTALTVGTVLSLVNQGDTVLGGDATPVTWLRVAVNYLIPFLVASIGWLSARHAPTQPGSSP